MRIRRVLATSLVLGLGAGFWIPPTAAAQETRSVKSVTPAANVGNEIIRLEEVEQALSVELAKIEQQRFQLLEQKLEQFIGDRLLAQEAKKRNMTAEQLLRAEVYANAPEVAEGEVTTFMTQNRARFPQGDEAEVRLKAWDWSSCWPLPSLTSAGTTAGAERHQLEIRRRRSPSRTSGVAMWLWATISGERPSSLRST